MSREVKRHTRCQSSQHTRGDVEDDDPQLMEQIKDAMNDVRDMDTGSSLTLQERESMLNVDQKRIFDHVKAHLLRQIEYCLQCGRCHSTQTVSAANRTRRTVCLILVHTKG